MRWRHQLYQNTARTDLAENHTFRASQKGGLRTCRRPYADLPPPLPGKRARVATWRLTHVSAERGAEGAGRTVSDPFGDLGKRHVAAA